MEWNLKDHPHFPKPEDARGYLEQMSKIVFSAGLNWNVVNKKWPDIKSSFADFAVAKVAKFDSSDVDKMLKDAKMIRSGGKINAVIKNARAILDLEKEFGSFRSYFDKFNKDTVGLLKDLKKRFSYLGDSTSVMFLYGVGEQSKELEKIMHDSHKK